MINNIFILNVFLMTLIYPLPTLAHKPDTSYQCHSQNGSAGENGKNGTKECKNGGDGGDGNNGGNGGNGFNENNEDNDRDYVDKDDNQ